MDDKSEIMSNVRAWSELTDYDPDVKAKIEAYYLATTGKEFVPTTCRDCYRDACILIYSHLKKGLPMASERTYHLKAGALLQMGFGSAEMYTEANLTDEAARRYLAINHDDIKYFSAYPENWESDVKGEATEATEAEETTSTKRVIRRKRK